MHRFISSPVLSLLALSVVTGGCSSNPVTTPGLSAPSDRSASGSSGEPAGATTAGPGADAAGGDDAGSVAASQQSGAVGPPAVTTMGPTAATDASTHDAATAMAPPIGSDAGTARDAGATDARTTVGGGKGDASSSSDAGAANGCRLPTTVSFQTDVQPFLITSCNGTGCHVIDAASTMGNGGYNHAYDWITAGAHASSCPGTPTPFRYQVIMAVITQANPPSCSKSEKMPPPTSSAATWPPLTTCQAAALQAWLEEPLVTQMHRVDDSSPTTPYPMPPFN